MLLTLNVVFNYFLCSLYSHHTHTHTHTYMFTNLPNWGLRPKVMIRGLISLHITGVLRHFRKLILDFGVGVKRYTWRFCPKTSPVLPLTWTQVRNLLLTWIGLKNCSIIHFWELFLWRHGGNNAKNTKYGFQRRR